MSLIEHSPEDDDGTDDWRPFDQRKWSRVELLAEIDALNAEVAKWVGIVTERKGAVDVIHGGEPAVRNLPPRRVRLPRVQRGSGRDLCDQAVEAVEEHLHRLIPDDPALPEEWWADQADEIVELVLEAAQPRGAVGERDNYRRTLELIADPHRSPSQAAGMRRLAREALDAFGAA